MSWGDVEPALQDFECGGIDPIYTGEGMVEHTDEEEGTGDHYALNRHRDQQAGGKVWLKFMVKSPRISCTGKRKCRSLEGRVWPVLCAKLHPGTNSFVVDVV